MGRSRCYERALTEAVLLQTKRKSRENSRGLPGYHAALILNGKDGDPENTFLPGFSTHYQSLWMVILLYSVLNSK